MTSPFEAFDGGVAVVTGGGGGIGAALASRLSAEGMRVAIADLDRDAAAAIAAPIDGTPYTLDVSDEAAVAAMIADVEGTVGPIDLLCLNAGIANMEGLGASNEVWERTWQVNVMSHVYGLRAALPAMIARGSGHVMHTASAAGLLTNIGAASYSVTKHAVIGLAEWVAVTYGDLGISVSALCPQFVETDLLDALTTTPGTREWASGASITAAEVANAVVAGLRTGGFLILPHPEVEQYMRHKTGDYDRWLGGMRKLQRTLDLPPPDLT